MSKAKAAVSPAPGPKPWLFSAPLDLLVGCGGWSLPLIALTSYVMRANPVLLASAFYFLTVFCNNPHYMATIYRAYHTGADFNRYRFFTIYVTVLLVLTVTLVHLVPALFPWVVTLYIMWSPWHYTGQNFGVAMLLTRRAGAQPAPQERQLLFASYIAAYLVWAIALQSLETPDPGLIVVGLPKMVARILLPVLSTGFVVLAGLALVRIGRVSGVRAVAAPALLSLTQGLWFIGPPLLQHFHAVNLPATYYSAGVLAFMHCAQYLWITTYYARRESETGAATKEQRFRFARYYITLIVGGLALFIPGPWIASRLLKHEFVESFLIFAALVNLHHFILDGAIWKLRDSRIARLLVGRNAPEKDTDAPTEGLPQLLRWLVSDSTTARGVRYGFATAVLALGILDQAQFNFSGKAAGLTTLARAETFNPQDARVYFNRAKLLLSEGQMNAAEAELHHAIDINPRNVPAQQLLGEVLFKKGDAPAALAHYEKLAEMFRPDVPTLLNRGLLARQLGSNELAAHSFEDALRLSPERSQLHFLLGDALAVLGRTNAAIESLARFIQLHETATGSEAEFPLYFNAALRLGELQAGSGRWAEAEQRWQRAADVALALRQFGETSMLLEKVATAKDRQGKTEEAASARRAAEMARDLARKTSAPAVQ